MLLYYAPNKHINRSIKTWLCIKQTYQKKQCYYAPNKHIKRNIIMHRTNISKETLLLFTEHMSQQWWETLWNDHWCKYPKLVSDLLATPHHKQYEKIKERRKKPDHCRSNMKTRNQKKLWKEALLARIEFWSSWSWQVSHRSIWLSLIYEGGEKEHEVIIQLLCCQNEGWGPLTRQLWHESKFTKKNCPFCCVAF